MFYMKLFIAAVVVSVGVVFSGGWQAGESVVQAEAMNLKGRGCNGMVAVSKCEGGIEIQGNWFYCPGQDLFNLNNLEGGTQKLYGAVCYLPGFPQSVDTNCGIWTKSQKLCNGQIIPVRQVVVSTGP